MKRCVIISAGQICDYERSKSFLQSDDFYIFCDGGLTHAEGLGVKPDVIVGDFDSCTPEDLARWKDSGGSEIADGYCCPTAATLNLNR